MSRSMRDLLLDLHQLQSDLRDAHLLTAASRLNDVIEAVRNRQAYDEAERGNDDEQKV